MSDLAGFILIFISVIIFGLIYSRGATTTRIELLESETTGFLVENDLIDFLSYEENGRTIFDRIILDDIDYVYKKSKEIFPCDDRVNRWILIYKNGNLDREISCSYHLDKPEKMRYVVRKDSGEGIVVELTTLYNPYWVEL